jgi:hypothetical protein
VTAGKVALRDGSDVQVIGARPKAEVAAAKPAAKRAARRSSNEPHRRNARRARSNLPRADASPSA